MEKKETHRRRLSEGVYIHPPSAPFTDPGTLTLKGQLADVPPRWVSCGCWCMMRQHPGKTAVTERHSLWGMSRQLILVSGLERVRVKCLGQSCCVRTRGVCELENVRECITHWCRSVSASNYTSRVWHFSDCMSLRKEIPITRPVAHMCPCPHSDAQGTGHIVYWDELFQYYRI